MPCRRGGGGRPRWRQVPAPGRAFPAAHSCTQLPRLHRLSHHSAPRTPAVARTQRAHSWKCVTTSRETREGREARGLPSSPHPPQPAAAHPHSRGPALGAAGPATEEKVRRQCAPGHRVCLSCSAAAAMLKDGEPERTSTDGRGRDRKCVTWERKCTVQRDVAAVDPGWLVWNKD